MLKPAGTMQSALLEQVGRVLREVAQAEIVTRFQKLDESDVISKATVEDPLDLVTSADRAAEAALTARLRELVPNSTVVGEEAVAADPAVLDRLKQAAPVWIVDPLDGTKNFAAGHGPFGTMVVLAERGTPLLSGIYLPETDRLFLAERGLGAYLDGARMVPRAPTTGALAGTAYSRFMPEHAAAVLMARAAAHTQIPSVICAAHEYTQIAMGLKDYTHYYRLLPWDHAPGALIVREAGGVVRHPDGRDYHVFDTSESTLLSPDEGTWQRARAELFD
ncbi:MAG TPA: inositol monophosphatase family protein [Polyangiaceae bacterium]|nr:inositol monophosphatase family protein [Polyangiaceae bacterium]